MGSASVARTVAASADTVWGLMSWRGMERLDGRGLFADVLFEDDHDQAGSLKRVTMTAGITVRERLEWVDETAKAYAYRILDTGGLPVASYEATVRITAMGEAACAIVITCSFVALGTTDEEYAARWTEMETELLAQIAATAER